MAEIGGEILIARPAGEVYDFVAVRRNEPHYIPRMVRAAKVTDGPDAQPLSLTALIPGCSQTG